MKAKFGQKYPALKDLISFLLFVAAVVVGTWLLNSYVFRSYNVVGVSMENTLHGGDRIIVNRLPVTGAHILEKEYIPERGQIIVFANGGNEEKVNCRPLENVDDKYIIKRVIAFPEERVVLKDGELKVYNDENPDGFNPDDETRKSDDDGPKSEITGEVDLVVPKGEIFVSGDNREGSNSYDSRNGLGTIPFCRIVGPAAIRIYPFNKIRFFN
ncbi:signal peptidase I [Candidatus Saccharibacteria bacterium]|jgi:signal peptidase I|nr:signal peptidase I [Candidatus Saccharibacteria bacterium]